MAGLVLDEFGVPAVLYEVGDVRAAKRMQIQSGRQIQFVAVAPEAAQQGGLSDQAAALAGEQVNAVVDIRLAVGEPVGDDFGCPVEHREHGAPLRR